MKRVEGFTVAKKLLDRRALKNPQYKQEAAVRVIIENVRLNGDAALFEYAEKFDGVKLKKLEISPSQVKAAYKKVDSTLVAAMQLAAERIASFHRMQQERALKSYTHGKTGWVVRPLEKIGVYAPGGTASYPSTVLMVAIPARVAGVKEIILTSPPGRDGKIPPVTLVAADIAGVDKVFAIGGAQAIAALAYGTASVPRVDKICGPGNIWVFLAKKLLYGTVGIDALQGPSDVAILADETADPDYCASDLLAQSEHGEMSQAILVTNSRALADRVVKTVEKQLKSASRKEILTASLENNCIIAVVKTMEEAIDLVNLYAPEHALVLARPNTRYEERIRNAGCIIYGNRATVPMSDYISGPSHSLPTEGTSRFSSALNVTDFVKITNLSSVGEALMNLAGPAAVTIARAEGLDAHAAAMQLRLGKTKRK